MTLSAVLRATFLVLAVSSTGCFAAHEAAERALDDDESPDPSPSASPPDPSPRVPPPGPPACTPETYAHRSSDDPVKVDLLFVVDDSSSMSEEQRTLGAQFGRLVRVLTEADLDDDGVRDFYPVDDLHVGVVTTDLGDDGRGGCGSVEGDDAVLRDASRAAGCARAFPSFLSFVPGATGPEVTDGVGGLTGSIADDFQCLASVGTRGCGYEQPLEAALKALTPSTSPLRFARDTVGHGDLENAGFLRSDSVLGVVVVTDEDDCSVRDPELFDPLSSRYATDTNLRCTTFPDALHPISRFVDGLRLLRPTAPETIVFAAIVGVPEDLVADPARVDYDRLLADGRMQVIENPERRGHLLPACDVIGRGFAVPARRIAEVARGFGERGVVQSVCQESFTGALVGITSRLARVIRSTRCVER